MNNKKIVGVIFLVSVIIILLLSGYVLVFGSFSPKAYSGIFLQNGSESYGYICEGYKEA